MEEPSMFPEGQTAQSLTCSLMEKPHTGLNMLLSCLRKRMSACQRPLMQPIKANYKAGERRGRARASICHGANDFSDTKTADLHTPGAPARPSFFCPSPQTCMHEGAEHALNQFQILSSTGRSFGKWLVNSAAFLGQFLLDYSVHRIS